LDTLVKERLTGAIILVALIVVLVPELLNGPIRPAARVHGPATPAEEPPLRSYTINLADEPRGGSGAFATQQPAGSSPPAPAPEPAAAVRAAPSTTASAPTTAAVRPTPAASVSPPPTPAPASRSAPPPHGAAPPAATSAEPASSGSFYFVQLGSFASRSNAERLAQQVRGLGYTVSVSRGTKGRRLYRVQVGPARERAAAEQLAAKLRTQGHGGAVVAK
jgi:DedD protein